MVIDAHSHIGLNNGKMYSAEDLVASLKAARIDYSLVITFQGTKYSQMDSVIKLSKKFPQFKVIGNVKYELLNESEVEKIKTCLKEKKIVGVKFYLGYEDYYAIDKKLHPIYSFCQENNYPVVFHTGVLEKGFKGLLKQSHPLNVDDVSNAFPALKIVIAHMGNPWLMDCAAVVMKNENVYADMSGFFGEYKPIAEDEIQLFLKQMTDLRSFMGNFKKMIFGTDYPLYNQKEYFQAVQRLPLTEEEKDLVFWANAKNIFNLDI